MVFSLQKYNKKLIHSAIKLQKRAPLIRTKVVSENLSVLVQSDGDINNKHLDFLCFRRLLVFNIFLSNSKV